MVSTFGYPKKPLRSSSLGKAGDRSVNGWVQKKTAFAGSGESDYFFKFRESDDRFVIGLNSGLQKVATRQDSPPDKAVMLDNASQFR
jgi:hypothetical protein